ncbi:MAG: dihydrolipoyl dehydrogenase [Methylacidiphilales bacterium]|nr:dihydrolipoyl dehydrogenase [Candidatus Methylacidiphilales bacterium]
MENNHFQVAVIGAGPGGYTAAFRCADLGLTVALIDDSPVLGGVCLNVGCIPSKALLHVAEIISETKTLSKHGVVFSEPSIDIHSLIEWKDSIIKQLTSGLTSLAKKRNVKTIMARATFKDSHTLTLSNNSTITFENCIIATGSSSATLPHLPSHSLIFDSTSALSPKRIPESLLIIGGGIIGLEMACIYSSLGTKVSVAEFLPTLLPQVDAEISKPLMTSLMNKQVQLKLNTSVTSCAPTDHAVMAKLTHNETNKTEEQSFASVLVAVGRTPNSNISPELAQVFRNEKGFIPSNDQMQTNAKHIYSIGDVKGQPMLAHKASHEAKIAAETIAGKKSYFDVRTIPSVAYTDPEIAWCGITEKEAKLKNLPYLTQSFPWQASGRALAVGAASGITKIIVEPDTKRIMGMQICGKNAGELIAEAMLAIEMGADIHDLTHTIHPHPTLSETTSYSAEMVAGTITDLYLNKK